MSAIRKTGQFTTQPRIDAAPAAARTTADLPSLYPADVEHALQLLTQSLVCCIDRLNPQPNADIGVRSPGLPR
ncbi:hypothetical protein [Ralstonia psammae]|uniref:hypothetical protein n=1 Tax=Ralstonia psammae TaxID=3058598 RepID=UPI00292EE618|nr:hypothetical protein [Ralstonia sp. LMG 19083]